MQADPPGHLCLLVTRIPPFELLARARNAKQRENSFQQNETAVQREYCAIDYVVVAH